MIQKTVGYLDYVYLISSTRNSALYTMSCQKLLLIIVSLYYLRHSYNYMQPVIIRHAYNYVQGLAFLLCWLIIDIFIILLEWSTPDNSSAGKLAPLVDASLQHHPYRIRMARYYEIFTRGWFRNISRQVAINLH